LGAGQAILKLLAKEVGKELNAAAMAARERVI